MGVSAFVGKSLSLRKSSRLTKLIIFTASVATNSKIVFDATVEKRATTTIKYHFF